ncbi:type VI secretion system baseplate subunit TssK [Defluviimonas aestuarii]|uniref:type VI secretion system baseplate subunit TssK n=1 Tax=Albidovulum aestuarii TaxID=1130726 RepID=UPI002499D2DD|nr:type VI secretion system baseplate subunit TssK [Defluviimonas aestuarii]MDI3337737.1 type VI secretion system baseplate subunit TssK [Defluviimonas aestuarii]
MTERNKVVWSEGLFLRTQHFQQQDRYAEALMRAGLRAGHLQTYGFSALELDTAALDAGQIAVAKAEGLFPDGSPFAIPGDMEPPPALAVKGDAAGLVSLAIPVESRGAASVDPAHAEPTGARYRGTMITARDAVRGGAETEEIEVARLAARLIAPGDEMAGYTTLALARVEGLKADGSVALSDGYLPPALTIGAAPWYAGLLKELVTGLERIAEAHGGLVRGGAGRSVENLLILELANAAQPRLAHLLTQDLCHPSDLFGELAGLAGRMATYGSSSRRLTDLPAYDHAAPQSAFAALADTLRSMILSLRHVEPKSRALPVAKHSQNIWKVRIDNPELLKSSRIVLRVGSEMSDESLRRIFAGQATVGAADEFEKLWKSRLPGIALKPLHSQPREIPYDGERLCLELDQKSEHWTQLLEAPGFVIGVSGKLEREPQIDCYAVSR